MSWRFVYNKIKELLESREFKEQNSKFNPGQEEDAINVALWHLLKEYKYRGGQWGSSDWLNGRRIKIHTGVEIGKICWRCGKPIVQYYNILCMDCADELGISEIFLRGKSDEEIKEIVKKAIEDDLKKAIKLDSEGRIIWAWYPMLSRFPNITVKGLLALMLRKEVEK